MWRRKRAVKREVKRLRGELAMLEKGTRYSPELNLAIAEAKERLEAAERLTQVG
jgi:hypothetical protein